MCALMNKYWPQTNTRSAAEKEEQLDCKMLHISKQQNVLHEKIQSDSLKKILQIGKISASSVLDFPRLSEEDIRNLTVGMYQLKPAPSYTREHLDINGSFDDCYATMSQTYIAPKFSYNMSHREATEFGFSIVKFK